MAAEIIPALPTSTVKLWRELRARRAADLHPGLQLDKYLPIFEVPQAPRADSAPKFQEVIQRPALELVCKTSGDQVLLDSLLQRRQALFDDIHRAGFAVKRFTAVTAAPLTLHLARGAALENAGICLHPLYGFVFLPGSGLKGMTRAYAETIWAAEQADKAQVWKKIGAVFGWAPHSEEGKPWKPAGLRAPAGAASGAIVFHDAWPLRWPRLALDIVNNHHSAYYSAGDKDKVPPPGDWENPSPVTFLAVDAGQTFGFALTKRDRTVSHELLELATQWLTGALTVLGAGAKTAAGYGAFRIDDSSAGVKPPAAPAQTRISETFTLELVTPAFLAGARQQKEDCELRSAALRGLLRWWWRTMHAARVDPATLRRLESTVWGNTEAPGAVTLRLEPIAPAPSPLLYDKEQIRQTHQLPRPSDRKTAQGLFYLSYGMHDGGRQRYFLPQETRWKLTLSARDSFYPANARDGRRVAAANIMGQAHAALSLLCRFGGIGSKSRKGFGSLSADMGVGLSECTKTAADFRALCAIANNGRSDSPALEDLLGTLEISLSTKNYWEALDQLGFAVQDFAKKYRHRAEKKALGLPRRIGAPQTGSFEPKPPVRDRHAAPILYHLARNTDSSFLVRVAAFPAARLPNLEQSRAMLKELLDHLKRTLNGPIPSTSTSPASESPGPPRQRTGQATPNLYAPSTPRGQRKGGNSRTGPKRR